MALLDSRSVPLSADNGWAMLGSMTTDRIVLVGVAWTILLVLLLVLQRVVRARRRPVAASVRRVLDVLTAVMIVAFAIVTFARLGVLLDPPGVSAEGASPAATVAARASGPVPPMCRVPRPCPRCRHSPSRRRRP